MNLEKLFLGVAAFNSIVGSGLVLAGEPDSWIRATGYTLLSLNSIPLAYYLYSDFSERKSRRLRLEK